MSIPRQCGVSGLPVGNPYHRKHPECRGRFTRCISDDLQLEQFCVKIQEVAPGLESTVMTIAEQMRQEGREEGELSGLLRGSQKMFRKQIWLEFGELSIEDELKIAPWVRIDGGLV